MKTIAYKFDSTFIIEEIENALLRLNTYQEDSLVICEGHYHALKWYLQLSENWKEINFIHYQSEIHRADIILTKIAQCGVINLIEPTKQET